jgi:hypothetical protein
MLLTVGIGTSISITEEDFSENESRMCSEDYLERVTLKSLKIRFKIINQE